MKRAAPGVKVKDVFTIDTTNKLLDLLNKPNSQRRRLPSEPFNLKVKSESGMISAFTPVALSAGTQRIHNQPILIASPLIPGPWGVTQQMCSTTRVADIVTHGVSWCNITVVSTSHKYVELTGSTLSSTSSPGNAVGAVLFANEDGPSLIQFPYERKPNCVDLLEPDTYPAIAGTTTVGGALGAVIYDGVTYPATNQSKCTVNAGDPVSWHVSKKCESFFTPCSCSCEEPIELDCCDRFFGVCLFGRTHLLKPNTGFSSVTFLTGFQPPGEFPTFCCIPVVKDDGPGFLGWTTYIPGINIELECDGSTITANYEAKLYFLGVYPDPLTFDHAVVPASSDFDVPFQSGSWDWSALCAGSTISQELTLSFFGETCSVEFKAGPDALAALCSSCDGTTPEPESCCSNSRWFCVNNDSRELDFDGGDETWDVTECCPDCTSATLRNRLTCSNGIVSLQQTYTCDGVVSTQTTTLSPGICNSTAPITINFSTGECFLTTIITAGASATDCDSCESCCDETRWFCSNSDSAEIALDGGTTVLDVRECTECISAFLTLNTSCEPLSNSIAVAWSLNCDGVITTGTEYILCSEAEETVILNLDVPGSFIQVQMSLTDIGCAVCAPTGTTEI
jgi:hypothetical protein